MNRNWLQIFVGAAALTGAFFFGSVMQRRHGDLDKKVATQPMLENEDLVWQSTAKTEEANARPQPMVSSQEKSGEPAVAGEIAAAERSGPDSSRTKPAPANQSAGEPAEPPARKVVQPDFSRWGNSVPPGAETERVAEAAPMLPLGQTPPLLDQPAQPSGPLNPPRSHSSVQPLGLASEPTPAHDPWTAPLSSVLLNPPVKRQEATQQTPATAPAPAPSEAKAESTPAPMLPATAGRGDNPANSLPQTANQAFVPVNQQSMRKVEIDTDSFRIHVVRAGDTLQSIAQRYYGKTDFYLDIYLANQDQLTSPINLPAGKALKIPDYSK